MSPTPLARAGNSPSGSTFHSYGKVTLVRHRMSLRVCAMKTMVKQHLVECDSVRNTRVERDILTSVSHPFLVELLCAFQTTSKVYLVMTSVGGQDSNALRRKMVASHVILLGSSKPTCIPLQIHGRRRALLSSPARGGTSRG